MKPEMTAETLIDLLQLLESSEIEVWLDGGWAVDAVLGDRHDHTETSTSFFGSQTSQDCERF